LEIRDIFKDEDKEEEDSVIDLILAVVELLRRDISRLVVEA
jgi:predicted Zn-ribbon and HTH transcriptional regulator